MNEMMNLLFKPVTLCIDPMSGGFGIPSKEGVITLIKDEDGKPMIQVNPILAMAPTMQLPATRQPVENVAVGDIYVYPTGRAAFVVAKSDSAIWVLNASGTKSKINNRRVMGMGDGFMVIKVGSQASASNPLMMAMLFGSLGKKK